MPIPLDRILRSSGLLKRCFYACAKIRQEKQQLEIEFGQAVPFSAAFDEKLCPTQKNCPEFEMIERGDQVAEPSAC
ncbi:hypothetical protein ACFOD4_01665 [Pseudoroseomonas globiformis]|uniref:Uncharacterized protein n=1 Tax=Teichococcus globiformis TaxID=2307229 RepID=A0ABV7FTV2_9PROT